MQMCSPLAKWPQSGRHVSESWPTAIPPLLHFVVKDSSARARSQNMNRSIALFQRETGGRGKVIVWGDDKCRATFRCLGGSLGDALALRFDQEKHGPYKSDLCRYAVLNLHGGLYIDDDLQFIAPPGAVLQPSDTFVAPRESRVSAKSSSARMGLFQAYLAAAPAHVAIASTLNALAQQQPGGSFVHGMRRNREILLEQVTRKHQHSHRASKQAGDPSVGVRFLREGGLHRDDPLWRPFGVNCNCVVRDNAKRVYFYSHVYGSPSCPVVHSGFSPPLDRCTDNTMPNSEARGGSQPRSKASNAHARRLPAGGNSTDRQEADKVSHFKEWSMARKKYYGVHRCMDVKTTRPHKLRPNLPRCCGKPPLSPASKSVSRPTVSAIVSVRNDHHGGNNLPSRANVTVAAMLEVFDEVVMVDMATPDGTVPLLSLLGPQVQTHPRLRSIVVSEARCARLLGCNGCCGGSKPFHEVFARNVGLAAARGDVLISTNIDVIPPCRAAIELLISSMPSWQHAFTLTRKEVRLVDATRVVAERNKSTALNAICPWALTSYIGGIRESEYVRTELLSSNTRQAWSIKAQRVGQRARPKDALQPAIALLNNCGDFQMGWRELWERASFAMALDGKRNNADTLIQAQWFNLNVSIHLPSRVYVWHVSHARPAIRGNINRTSMFNPDPVFTYRLGEGLANLRAPNIKQSGPLLSSRPVAVFAMLGMMEEVARPILAILLMSVGGYWYASLLRVRSANGALVSSHRQ